MDFENEAIKKHEEWQKHLREHSDVLHATVKDN